MTGIVSGGHLALVLEHQNKNGSRFPGLALP